MRSRGPLQWKGSKLVQWAVTVIGAIDAVVCVVLFARSLVFFGSLILLDLLYRWASPRPSA